MHSSEARCRFKIDGDRSPTVVEGVLGDFAELLGVVGTIAVLTAVGAGRSNWSGG